MKLALTAIALVCALGLPACSSTKSAEARGGESTDAALRQDEVLALINKVERDPLSDGAAAVRPRIFEWIISNPKMQGIQAHGRYLQKLEASDHRMSGELLLQFVFGMAAWRLTTETGVVSQIDEIDAGLRSVVVAYRVMVAAEPELRLAFLDDLSEIARRGSLRDYIARVDAIEAGE